MNDLKKILLCCRADFRRALRNPRIYVVMTLVFPCQYFAFKSLPVICDYLGGTVTPWLFPLWLSYPAFFPLVGAMGILLYCDVPFLDGHSPFLIARAGRRNWILGQILYTILSALLYTLWTWLSEVLLLLPYVRWEGGWGDTLWRITTEPEIVKEAGLFGTIFSPSERLMRHFSPMEAMGLSILIYFLGTVLVGMIIMCFGLMGSAFGGIAICAAMSGMAYLACYLGRGSYGGWLYYVSPINWMSMLYLDWYGAGGIVPPGDYAITVFVLLCAVLTVLSVTVFCKKDIQFRMGGR